MVDATPLYNEKNILEVPLGLSFHSIHSFNSNCEMVEPRILRSYGKFENLNIRQTKLFSINLKNHTQTCSNDHLCKTTTRLRRLKLSPSEQSPYKFLTV